jgi:hypothetical protein
VHQLASHAVGTTRPASRSDSSRLRSAGALPRYAPGMGLLDWILGRRPSKAVEAAAPKVRTSTIKRADGTVETRVVEDDGSTFEDWVASMDAKNKGGSASSRTKKSVIEEAELSVLDLRQIASVRARIVGTANYVSDAQRSKFGGTEYLLVREPRNKHDSNAVAIYGKGRKVGYVSANKAASIADMLDALRFDAFKVGGTGTLSNSSRLWADLPTVPGLRAFVAHQKRAIADEV